MRRGEKSDAGPFAQPLVDALALPAFVLSVDHRITSANAACHALLGGSDEALCGDLGSRVCQTSRRAVLRHLDRITAGQVSVDIAVVMLAADDGPHLFLAVPLRDNSGTTAEFVCQLTDAVQRHENLPLLQSLHGAVPIRTWQLDVVSGQICTQAVAGTAVMAMTATSFHDHLKRALPIDQLKLRAAFAALVSGADEQLCLSYRMRDGETDLTLLAEGHVTRRDADGFPVEISVIEKNVSDVLYKPIGDTSLAETELRWKTAVLSANQGIWDHDFEREIHFLSKTWRDLRGLDENDAVPNATEEWLDTIHPNDLPHIEEELRRLDTGETDAIHYQFRQRHRDGHWIWFLSSGRVVRRDADGRMARIIGTDTDITDIKTVEIESQRMAERLDVAMQAAGMARWEYNVNADQAFWDDRLLEMFGVTDGLNRRSGSDWATYIHPEDRARTVAHSEEMLRQKRDVAYDYRSLMKDGSVRHIRTRGKYVDDAMTGPRYYGVNFDITQDKLRAEELEEARARLEHESRHDALTGLANRRRLDDVYTDYLKTAPAPTTRLAVLHFDIDHFKQINDTLGHDAGDATLKHAADILRRNAPEGALVSRVGGDEFVALLFGAPEDDALQDIAERIIFEMSQPFHYGSQQCNIGTSIGIAVSEGETGHQANLFIDADLALYEAKKAGRGRYRFYNAIMKEEARRRKNSFDALLAGFDQGEITCHYQPQFDAKTLQLTGLEALVRWESADYGLIMPDEFLQTADDMGLLAQFDELVLRRALYDMRCWQETGVQVPQISVNVSAHRLNDPNLGDQLRDLELPRGMISFELLESAFLDARNDVIDRNLKMIGQLGIATEIDDFGSGHASIASLLQVSPRRLKIDRTLIEPIVDSHRQRELVRTIIGIGRMLDIGVVAEGVETAAHVPILQQMECCYLQGFGLARPMDAQAVGAFLRELDSTGGRLKLA